MGGPGASMKSHYAELSPQLSLLGAPHPAIAILVLHMAKGYLQCCSEIQKHLPSCQAGIVLKLRAVEIRFSSKERWAYFP